jgi:hypothetical protein
MARLSHAAGRSRLAGGVREPGERIGAAQRVRDPVPSRHPSNQVGSVLRREPSGGDEHRPGRLLTAVDGDRMRGEAEASLGDPDHRHTSGIVKVSAEPGPTIRVQVDVPVDHQQVEWARGREHGHDRRQLAQVEQARLVRRDGVHLDDPLAGDRGEGRLDSEHGRSPGTAAVQIVHIHRGAPRSLVAFHWSSVLATM